MTGQLDNLQSYASVKLAVILDRAVGSHRCNTTGLYLPTSLAFLRSVGSRHPDRRIAMRIPIYETDLLPKHGFKRIVRAMERSWPLLPPITHHDAIMVLARGLGYDDYHDLQKCSVTLSWGSLAPTLAEILDQISTSIVLHMQRTLGSVADPRLVSGVTASLPLHSLLTLKTRDSQPGKTTTALLNSRIDSGLPILPSDSIEKAQLTETIRDHKIRRRSIGQLFSPEQLSWIADVVEVRGNLREQAIFALVLNGMRVSELVASTVGSQRSVSQEVVFSTSKTRTPEKSTLTLPNGHVIARYIRQTGLHEGDYLFPSRRNRQKQSSPTELQQVARVWFVAAHVELIQATMHNIRLSADKIASQRGHRGLTST